MNSKSYIICLLSGLVGLISGFTGYITQEPILSLFAGLFSLTSGFIGIKIIQNQNEEKQRLLLIENELKQVKEQSELAEKKMKDLVNGSSIKTDAYSNPDILLDKETGLFSENFFTVTLESRVASARRNLRPISVILLDVVMGTDKMGEKANTQATAEAVSKTIREADTACHLDNGYFALVLEDTPETGAVWTVERIRRALSEENNNTTLWAGIACYPAHAFTQKDLFSAANSALDSARDWKQDRIEIALSPE